MTLDGHLGSEVSGPQRTGRRSMRPRCSSHDCELVEVEPMVWDCPISALHDLCNVFQQVYEGEYAPAPAGENGVYHRARRILAATSEPSE